MVGNEFAFLSFLIQLSLTFLPTVASERARGCNPGDQAVVFCGAPSAVTGGTGEKDFRAVASGCLVSRPGLVKNASEGGEIVLQLQDAQVVADEHVESTARHAKLGNVYTHSALQWARASVSSSCENEQAMQQWAARDCRDSESVEVFVSGNGHTKWLTCDQIKYGCGLGLSIDYFCPASCGICNSTPMHHFWGRLRHAQTSLLEYAQVQSNAMNMKMLDYQWASQNHIRKLAAHLKMMLPMEGGLGVCHGTRTGKEQQWFMEGLPGFQVWGTEIGKLGAMHNRTVSPWDFHFVPSAWAGRAAFVYSNSLDHSYNPPLAIQRWMQTLVPEGLLLLDFAPTKAHKNDEVSTSDVYLATMAEVQRLVLLSGKFEICKIINLDRGNAELQRTLVVAHEGRCDGHARRASRA